MGPDPLIRLVRSDALRPDEVDALRQLFDEAWSDDVEGFTDQDWSHAVGGVHVIAQADGGVVAHASVVQRELHTGGLRLRTGYVEAVATRPSHQRRGIGSLVIGEVGELIDWTYRLGALATGVATFYERLGWVAWEGPTFVRAAAALVRTAEEDGNVLVRLTPTSPELDLSAPISCEWRGGDAW
ncbi:MAG TPA: GNAT family N-acetyltransferase [Actinomycetota bacterium]|nr:GNAT family N-acetyltransferase [Actinomycetota bacterium]